MLRAVLLFCLLAGCGLTSPIEVDEAAPVEIEAQEPFDDSTTTALTTTMPTMPTMPTVVASSTTAATPVTPPLQVTVGPSVELPDAGPPLARPEDPNTPPTTIDPGPQFPEGPEGLAASLAHGLTDPGFVDVVVGVAISVEGWDQVMVRDADVALIPASNQKLATSVAVLEVLGPDHRFVTSIVSDRPPLDGVVEGDVFIVAGADPVLELEGPHSVEALAKELRGAGVERVRGDVLVDASRHPKAGLLPGWKESYTPAAVGPISAFVVAGNDFDRLQAVEDEAAAEIYFADIDAGNAELVREALLAAGVTVSGTAGVGRAPADGFAIASLSSPPIEDLVKLMLGESDNMAAELLVKELGREVYGEATSATGIAVVDEVTTRLLPQSEGRSFDGSGLSRDNMRSAREWFLLLSWVRESQWWPVFEQGLAVGGAETGTLRKRFDKTPATGNVRAKTGTIDRVRTLSGYVTTADGRLATFSFIANGDTDRYTTLALDALVDRIADHPG